MTHRKDRDIEALYDSALHDSRCRYWGTNLIILALAAIVIAIVWMSQ